jgi:hypothetical protein
MVSPRSEYTGKRCNASNHALLRFVTEGLKEENIVFIEFYKNL